MADITATNKQVLDFNHQLTAQADSFPTLSVLDNTGKIVDDEAFERAELSNEDLINIIKRMILSRQLDIRSTKLAKQGGLDFLHQQLVKKPHRWPPLMLLMMMTG